MTTNNPESPVLEPSDMTDDELKAAIRFHETEAAKFKNEAAKIWRLRVRLDGGIPEDKQRLAELHARRAARSPATSAAPRVDQETETMSRLYTDASAALDRLSLELSELCADVRLMRPVVDAAIAYTVEFKTGMTDEALQRLSIAVNAYREPASASPAAPEKETTHDHDSCSHWREGDGDHCVLCGDDLGPTTEADVAATSSSQAIKDAAREIAQKFLQGGWGTPEEIERIATIIQRHCFSAAEKVPADSDDVHGASK